MTRGVIRRSCALGALLTVVLGLGAAVNPARAAAPVRIAIVDSGILPTHSQFRSGQVVAWRDFVQNRVSPYDDLGHGTAVASRAAGRTLGAYPDADLVVAKILNNEDQAAWGNVASAIRWAADQQADVINVSIWSALPSPSSHAVNLARAVDYATAQGALVVWIAGNGGLVGPSTLLPGAASPQVLVVGASNSAGAPASFSQRDPEVLAHGQDVSIAWNDGGVRTGSGTSYAAPWVAGVAARMIAEGAPRDDPDWVKWVLLHSAGDRAQYTYVDEGYGLVDEAATGRAVAVSRGQAPVPGPDSRDAFHLATASARVAQSGSVPVGALPQ